MKCPDKHAREEKIETQFTQSLYQIKIDDDMEWIVAVMGASTAEERKQHEAQAAALNQQKQRLEERLEKMYLNKLDGVINDDEYARLSKKFRGDVADLKFRIEQLAGGNECNIDSGKRLLELAQKATNLYSAQIPAEKRKLLNSVYSNSKWAGGELAPNFSKPFDMIAETNLEYLKKRPPFLRKMTFLIFGVPYRI